MPIVDLVCAWPWGFALAACLGLPGALVALLLRFDERRAAMAVRRLPPASASERRPVLRSIEGARALLREPPGAPERAYGGSGARLAPARQRNE